jgi:hypothetical protein
MTCRNDTCRASECAENAANAGAAAAADIRPGSVDQYAEDSDPP